MLEKLCYAWACAEISNKVFKERLLNRFNLKVDLRQPDLGNWLELEDATTGDLRKVYF